MNPRDWRELPSALERLEEINRALTGKQPALFLDYDGTLTPIVKRPEDAILGEDMRTVLKTLASCCTVAVVSGRDRAWVEKLVGLQNLVYAGSHGFDISGPGGLHFQHEGGLEALPDLDKAERELQERLQAITGVQVERKRFAIAVHYRNAAESDLPFIKKTVREVSRAYERLKDSPGKKIIELKPDIAWDKGKALLWLLDRLGLAGDRVLPMYLGDDLTDEDALRVLAGGRGIGILVGSHGHPTSARFRLQDVGEVKQFLQKLENVLHSRGSCRPAAAS
jgi:trehalose 6-phosphate phosphatase